jgi:hypothetical protein
MLHPDFDILTPDHDLTKSAARGKNVQFDVGNEAAYAGRNQVYVTGVNQVAVAPTRPHALVTEVDADEVDYNRVVEAFRQLPTVAAEDEVEITLVPRSRRHRS